MVAKQKSRGRIKTITKCSHALELDDPFAQAFNRQCSSYFGVPHPGRRT